MTGPGFELDPFTGSAEMPEDLLERDITVLRSRIADCVVSSLHERPPMAGGTGATFGGYDETGMALNRKLRRELGAQTDEEALKNAGGNSTRLSAATRAAMDKIATRAEVTGGHFVDHRSMTHIPNFPK